MTNINSIIKVQSVCRAWLERRPKDNYSLDILLLRVRDYTKYKQRVIDINKKLKNKIRLPNYPSDITENLVKFAIYNKYNIYPTWDTKVGDLSLNNMRLEVKGSLDLINGGPCSFGPNEKWSRIYFVDTVHSVEGRFKIYEVKLSNTHEIWSSIKVNKNETYKSHCEQKRRPRINFDKLLEQIPDNYINILFDGHITDLKN